MRSAADLRTDAYREETLAALFFIAAGVAYGAGMPTFSGLMAAKAVLDTLCAVGCWIRCSRTEKLAKAAERTFG